MSESPLQEWRIGTTSLVGSGVSPRERVISCGAGCGPVYSTPFSTGISSNLTERRKRKLEFFLSGRLLSDWIDLSGPQACSLLHPPSNRRRPFDFLLKLKGGMFRQELWICGDWVFTLRWRLTYKNLVFDWGLAPLAFIPARVMQRGIMAGHTVIGVILLWLPHFLQIGRFYLNEDRVWQTTAPPHGFIPFRKVQLYFLLTFDRSILIPVVEGEM